MILSKEEIQYAVQILRDDFKPYHPTEEQEREAVAKAQLGKDADTIDSMVADGRKEAIKKVVEWGNEYCATKSHSSYAEPFGQRKHDCPDCWQALLEEVKE